METDEKGDADVVVAVPHRPGVNKEDENNAAWTLAVPLLWCCACFCVCCAFLGAAIVHAYHVQRASGSVTDADGDYDFED